MLVNWKQETEWVTWRVLAGSLLSELELGSRQFPGSLKQTVTCQIYLLLCFN